MKLTNLVHFSLLSMPIAGNEAFTPSFTRGLKGMTEENPRPEARQLRIIPTLLGTIMDIRARFDFFDGIFADILFGQAPSDAPSMTPSDSPTSAPSDVPVVAPSITPSAAPFKLNNVVGDKSHDFETCPDDPRPFDFTESSELTVMYAYQVELKPSAQVIKVTEKIEEFLQEKLAEQICITSTDTLGITSDPADSPGGICRPTGNGTCYVIAGRLTLLVGTLSEVSEVYCEFLETIRGFLSGDDVTTQLSEVASINSTILESLIPTFCTVSNWKEGVVNLAGEVSSTENSNGGASKTTIIPIVLSLVACMVAIPAMFIYMRHRKATHEASYIPSSSSGSDLNFEISDESESQATDPYRSPEEQNTHTGEHKTNSTPLPAALAASNQGEPPEVLFSPANFEPQVIFSPTHTEQEIIFSPSSSVASSVLFRSP